MREDARDNEDLDNLLDAVVATLNKIYKTFGVPNPILVEIRETKELISDYRQRKRQGDTCLEV